MFILHGTAGRGGLVVLVRATRNHGSRPPGLIVPPPREPVTMHHCTAILSRSGGSHHVLVPPRMLCN